MKKLQFNAIFSLP